MLLHTALPLSLTLHGGDHDILTGNLGLAFYDIFDLCPLCIGDLALSDDHIDAPSVMLTTASVNPLDSSRSSLAASFFCVLCEGGHIVDCILFLFFGHVFVVDDLKQGFFVFGSYLLSGQFCLAAKLPPVPVLVSTASPGVSVTSSDAVSVPASVSPADRAASLIPSVSPAAASPK